MLRVLKVKEVRKNRKIYKRTYGFVAILGRINYVTYHPFISVRDLQDENKVMKYVEKHTWDDGKQEEGRYAKHLYLSVHACGCSNDTGASFWELKK